MLKRIDSCKKLSMIGRPWPVAMNFEKAGPRASSRNDSMFSELLYRSSMAYVAVYRLLTVNHVDFLCYVFITGAKVPKAPIQSAIIS